ncbi:MAG: DUF6510 family protein [Thermomicrobiales bacterium]
MEDADLRLDGNAAAGLLTELFTFDMTTAQGVCSGCGNTFPVGTLATYGHTMGMILRCPGCDTAMIRVTHVRSGYFLDLRGTNVLRVTATA